MSQPIRFAINGFGRIGRAMARQWMAMPTPKPFQLVAINDIAPIETCAYLLEFDSVYGPAVAEIQTLGTTLGIGCEQVRFSQESTLDCVDLSDVDVLFESTGKAETRDFATAGLRAGARKVLISGPSAVADITVVEGANEDALVDQAVVSNASCTTNALAPLMRALDEHFGLVSGHMTTIHCYTGSQPTIDAPRGSALERNRAAALSMVPTTTSAARMIDELLPHLAGRVTGCAVRVPTASVSAVDLTCILRDQPGVETIHAALEQFAPAIIGHTDRPLVSSDMRARTESLVVARPETTVMADGLTRIFGWYDNEWGFSARMFDVARRMMSAQI